MSASGTSFYIAGGTLPHGAPSYVERNADDDLYHALKRGEFCYLLTARQMGKSSLMARAAFRLREEGFKAVVLDMTAIGQNLSPEQWYNGLLILIGQQLGLQTELRNFWRAHAHAGPCQRLFMAISEVVLPGLQSELNEPAAGDHLNLKSQIQQSQPETPSAAPPRLVIFVDEIDTVRSLPFSTEEFFAAIRACYNRRTEDPEFQRLTFSLLGVATPSDLIRDTRLTPFNIGRRIELNDFAAQEAAPLAGGLGREANAASTLLERILYWTNGHPYLTQRLCQAVAGNPGVVGTSGVDRICKTLFLANRSREQDDNLLFVRERMLRSQAELAALLSLYDQVLSGRNRVRDDESNPLVGILRLAGIARSVEGYLRVRNAIYFRVFDRGWVLANMPDAEVRRQRTAFRRGMLRTAAASMVILSVLGSVAVVAWNQSRLARKEAVRANQIASNEARQRQRAEDLLGELQIQRGAELLDEGDTPSGLAYLARVLRQSPSNRVAAECILSTLTHRNFGLPVASGLRYLTNVHFASFAPNGRTLVTGSQNGESYIWDCETGKSKAEPLRHAGKVNFAEFSPNCRLVATCSADKTARIWDVATGWSVVPPLAHEAEVWSARFSPDGRWLVTGAADQMVRVWSVSTGKLRFQPIRPERYYKDEDAYSLQFSEDGQWLVTGAFSRPLQFWSATTGEPIKLPLMTSKATRVVGVNDAAEKGIVVVSNRSAQVWNLKTIKPIGSPIQIRDWNAMPDWEDWEFSPTGDTLAGVSSDMNRMVLWDIRTDQVLTKRMEHASKLDSAQFSPDGQWIAAIVSEDATVRIWDANAFAIISEPLKHESPVRLARFSPDRQRLVTVTHDGIARIWDIRMGQAFARQLKQSPRRGVGTNAILFNAPADFSSDGKRLVTTSLGAGRHVWDWREGRSMGELLQQIPSLGYHEFSPDCGLVAAASQDGTMRILDIGSGKPVSAPIKHGRTINDTRFSPDGHRIATASEDGAVRIWDVSTGQALLEPIQLSNHEASNVRVTLRFSPDGQRLLTEAGRGVKIWDSQTGKLLVGPCGPDSSRSCVEFSPNGQKVAVGSSDGTVNIWDSETGRLLSKLLKHDGPVAYLRFSQDGQRILTAYRGHGTDRIWDVETGKPLTEPLTEILKNFTAVGSAEFSPDLLRVVTETGDHIATIWDSFTGQKIGELVHGRTLLAVRFSPDGHWVATTAKDGTARVWEVGKASLPTPAWLPELVEGVAGTRLNRLGVFEPVAWSELVRLREKLLDSPALDPYTKWAKWFFADRANRSISPSSLVTVPDYVRQCVLDNRKESLMEAVRLAPTNGLAWARLAGQISGTDADWYMRKAQQFAPEDPEIFLTLAETLMTREGRATEALGLIEQACEHFPQEARTWNAKGLILQKAKRVEEAYQCYSRALGLVTREKTANGTTRANILLNRAKLLCQGPRFPEAAIDFLELLDIDPGMASEGNDAVRKYVVPPSTVQLAAQALPLAEKLVALNPNDGNCLNTLGVAYYRAGQFEKAVETLLRATKANEKGATAFDLFFMAMGYHYIRQSDKAKESYRNAISWLETQKNLSPQWSEELRVIRAETEQLLGESKPH